MTNPSATHYVRISGVGPVNRNRRGFYRIGPWLAGCTCGWRDECPRLKRERAVKALLEHKVEVIRARREEEMVPDTYVPARHRGTGRARHTSGGRQ